MPEHGIAAHNEDVWHVLEASSVPVREFASALHTLVPTLGWIRHISLLAAFHSAIRFEILTDPPLPVAHFPLQRGFSRPLLRTLFPFAPALTSELLKQSSEPAASPLICTSPFYAPVAELWPGPVIYYATDLTVAYDRLNPHYVVELDRRLCRVAQLVCPNSTRIGNYLKVRAGCHPEKILCVPNATRSQNVLAVSLNHAADLPPDIADLSRPIAGVIGNLSANLDWIFLQDVIERAPWLSWVFVGPASMSIGDRAQAQARRRLLHSRARVRFVGPKPYGSLQSYARAFDVAVLPYLKREPTFSGSATRFYEHLAAGRPMLATRGVEQLLEQVPLLRVVDGPDQMMGALHQLKAAGFRDGLEPLRWRASQHETWIDRATTMRNALLSRRTVAKSSAQMA